MSQQTAEIVFVDRDFINLDLEAQLRQERSPEHIGKLQTSITSNLGLLQAPVVKADGTLIAGSCRIQAIDGLYVLGKTFMFNSIPVPEGKYPVSIVPNDMGAVAYLKAELEENTERLNLSWQDKTAAVAKIALLEQQLIQNKEPRPKTKKAPAPLTLKSIGKEAMAAAAEKLHESGSFQHQVETTQTSIKLQQALNSENEELKKKLQKAPNMAQAKKILTNHEKDALHAEVAAAQGKIFNSEMHTLYQGDCLEYLPQLPSDEFRVCITDPIYGIDAHKFGNAAGKMASVEHNYDDSYETFAEVLPKVIKQLNRVMKKDCHMYLACDLRNFHELRKWILALNTKTNKWFVPNNPVIQYKKAGGRVPHPGYTFRRSYEPWLYAYRGDLQENMMINDVIETTNDSKESHGARKPVQLIETFLKRSAIAGDSCLDFMAGTGVTLPACHKHSVKLTAIELDAANFGKCLARQKKLK